MNSLKTTEIPVATLRKRYLSRLYEHLPESDARRLKIILPLFAAKPNVTVADCLKKLFKRHKHEDAQTLFRTFRDRLKKAGQAAGLQITLDVDTHKRLPANQRRCWFTGPDDAAANVAEFSESSARLPNQPEIQSNVVTSTGQALEAGKMSVDFFVSFADHDRPLAVELTDQLRTNFKSSKTYVYDPWDQSRILAGENPVEETDKALRRAAFVLILVSPGYLGDDRCRRELARVLETHGSSLIPVRLCDVSEDRQDLRGLEQKKLFPPAAEHGFPRSYEDCTRNQKNRFAHKLFEQIELRLDARRVKSNKARLARALRQEKPEFRHCRLSMDDEARELAQRETEYWVEPNMSQTSLDSGFDPDAVERHAANASNALEVLEKWALDKKSPIYAAVLGEYGIGKTTTLKQFTHRLLDRRKSDPTVPLPIFVDLRGYSKTIRQREVPPLRQFLEEIFQHAWKTRHRTAISPDDIIRLVREEGAILIFDGLDEKLVHLDEPEARAFIRELWGALPPQDFRPGTKEPLATTGRPGKLLFSCRSHYFKTIRDQRSMLRGADRDDVRASDYLACILLPFNETQVRDYLTQVLRVEDRVNAALELFASVHNLTDLSHRPYLLSLMSGQIGKLEARRAEGGPVLGVTLYEMLVEEWLNRDEGKHYLQKEDKRRLMEDLAAALWREGAREWPWEQVRTWLGHRVASDTVLKARYLGDARKSAILDEDFCTSTFVLRPDTSADSFRFAHTSLQEFFLACYLVRALRETRPGDWDLPMPSIESLDFLGQLLAVERRAERRQAAGRALAALLAEYRPRATEAAFRYRLLAVERGLPDPDPGPVDLHGADLSGWTIAGHSQKPLDLRHTNFSQAVLAETRWRHVDLSGAQFRGAMLNRAEFLDTSAAVLDMSGANAVGSCWRNCRVRQLVGGGETEWHGASWVECELNPAHLGNHFELDGVMSRCRPDARGMERSLPLVDQVLAGPQLNWGHANWVSACAWSPDGARVLSGSYDHTLKVWDTQSGQCQLTLQGHANWVLACAWSPDGARVLSGSSDNTLKVWDAQSGQCQLTLQGHANGVLACAWSPDGARVLSGSYDKTLKVWDAQSGQCQLTLPGHANLVLACAWSPDGARVLSGSDDHTLKVWDAQSGQCQLTLPGHANLVRACAWSPDGARVLSGSYDHTLKVWDAQSGQCQLTLPGHANGVLACAWSPDGARVLSGSDDHTLKVWDAQSGQCQLTLPGHANGVLACAWSPDGARVLSGSDDHTLKVWDAQSGQCQLTLPGHANGVLACAWSPDGARVLSGSDDHTLKVWDAQSGQCQLTLPGHANGVLACAWSPDGARVLSGSYDHTLKVWDAQSGQCQLTLQGHANGVHVCAWSPDGARVLSGSSDHTLKVWDAQSGQCQLTLPGHADGVRACAWSPDGARVLSGSHDNTLKVWDAQSGQCQLTLQGHANWVLACAWSPDGARVLSGSSDKTLKVWDAQSGQCQLTLPGHANGVRACAWSPDGARVLSGSSDHTLKVWDAQSGQCLLTLPGHANGVHACAWSPDGARVLSGSYDHTLKVWDAQSGRELLTLALGPDGETAALDFEQKKLLACSPEAWRFISWRYLDQATGQYRLLPADHFAPLPLHPQK